MINKTDIYLKRGIEYKVISDKDTFKNNETLIVEHNKPPFNFYDPHQSKVKAHFLVNSSWECPICDSYSESKINKRIYNKLLKNKNIIDIQKNVKFIQDCKIPFNFMITLKDNTEIYIKYFSKKYYTNQIYETKYIQDIRNLVEDYSLDYIEITHLNCERIIPKLNNYINKYYL